MNGEAHDARQQRRADWKQAQECRAVSRIPLSPLKRDVLKTKFVLKRYGD